ncbi:hypothetical protein AVEN_257942-1 [Araneus ventricosus]|uniref:Uncharacterized protein n=1 Tax=Araneus ventricosus TaxID=182803 RepID=A0A4Y2SX00_ARAVE|nr:hypothetical protein AVEN_257942-1 [Araneus ventricosus]
MIGNLENDLKMVKNELRCLQGDIKKFNAERQSLLLQIRERNKHVENLKRDGDSLMKMNTCYDKKKTEILPSATYIIPQLKPSNGRLYATTTHASSLKAWRSWNEVDDDFSETCDDEPEMQTPKQSIRKPVRNGAYM